MAASRLAGIPAVVEQVRADPGAAPVSAKLKARELASTRRTPWGYRRRTMTGEARV
jgi:hypothetical protein